MLARVGAAMLGRSESADGPTPLLIADDAFAAVRDDIRPVAERAVESLANNFASVRHVTLSPDSLGAWANVYTSNPAGCPRLMGYLGDRIGNRAAAVNELLGLKRYGTFMGIMNAAVSVGLAIGPLVAGRIFDVTRSYTGAFEVAAVVSIITAIAIQLCPVPGPAPAAAVGQSGAIATKSAVPGG